MRLELEIPDDILRIWDEMQGPIVKIPHPALTRVAEPVGKPGAETRALVERMKQAMLDACGVGLAAPQLGVSQRVIVYKLPEEDAPIRVMVDPKILSRKGEQIGPEGCLSIPRLQGDVTRAYEIVVRAKDLLGRQFKRRASEFEARVIQHEVDHLDGILFYERADPSTLHWVVEEEAEEAGEPALHE